MELGLFAKKEALYKPVDREARIRYSGHTDTPHSALSLGSVTYSKEQETASEEGENEAGNGVGTVCMMVYDIHFGEPGLDSLPS